MAERDPHVHVITPEQVPALLSKIALGWKGTRVRDIEDVVAPDGNHYILHGDCEGCLRLRSRVEKLEDAVTELQELFADAVTVLKDAGLIAAAVEEGTTP